MKIGIVNPYFDTLSGGELYMLSLAKSWSDKHDVSVFWEDSTLLEKAEQKFGIFFKNIHIVKNIFTQKSFLSKLNSSKAYDLIVFLSDGSIPTSFARHNILHVQAPIARPSLTFVEKVKLRRFDTIIVNSQFTKKYTDMWSDRNSEVLYPPVYQSGSSAIPKKKNQILSVGRFSNAGIRKSQDTLIEAFKKFVKTHKNFSLHLAGGVRAEDQKYVAALKKQSVGMPIFFYENAPSDVVKKLYTDSLCYWHGAGYGTDVTNHPEVQEHFGISIVEAMAHRCIVLAHNSGGPIEIIQSGLNGFLWSDIEDLVQKTEAVLLANDQKSQEIKQNAALRSRDFSQEKFAKRANEILEQIIL